MTPSTDARFVLREPEPDDYARLIDWIPDARAAHRWSGLDLAWPLETHQLALALQREGCTPMSLVDDRGCLVAFGEFYSKVPGRLRFARLIVDPA